VPAAAAPIRLDRVLARVNSRWQLVLAGLLLFGLAFGLRLVSLDRYLTADDPNWMRRAARFSQALERRDFAETYQSNHPGVPIYWVAALAFGPERSALIARTNPAAMGQEEKSPAYLAALVDARRAMALLAAGSTVVIAGLVWRLFGGGPGLLAGLLLAAEPFLVAHGALLHADPLLAHLMVISVLMALLYRRAGRWPDLLGSGLAAGLALSSKAPGILLFAFVPPILAAGALPTLWTAVRTRRRPGGGAARRLLAPLGLWGLAAGLSFVLIWPALWAAPGPTLGLLVEGVRGVGESPRTRGNFFLGESVTGDVGPLFYPLVTLLRLSPVTMLGLLLLGALALARRRPAWLGPVVPLLAYVVGFTALMTLSPKKIDRYLLPIFPILVILAALGWWLLAERLPWRRLGWLVLLGVVGLQVALVQAVQPYPLSFFNPLLGGAARARQAVIVGWGEGTDQIAAGLEQQPDRASLVVASTYHNLIHPLISGTAVPPDRWQEADYFALYVNMEQRRLIPGELQRTVRRERPVFTVEINGIDYARVYHVPDEARRAAGGQRSTLREATRPTP
jgi:hypothetical protein